MQNAKSQNVKIPLQALQMLFLKTFKSILQLFAIKLKLFFLTNQIRPDQISRSVVSDSLRPHESQHARPACPSQTPGLHSDSRPSSQ